MREKLINLKNEAVALVMQTTDPAELEQLRIRYVGKNGELNQLMKELPQLEKEERIEVGRLANDIKAALTEVFNNKLPQVKPQTSQFDPTLPGLKPSQGHIHPVSHAIEEITGVFEKIGFIRVRFPEVEWDKYAFESLNMPVTHPARDDWETFFIDTPGHPHLGRMLLTPHTSSGQVREMERLGKPPIRMLNIAKCYRRQSDISHTAMFHQFEGLVVDAGISIVHLRGTIDYFAHQFFGLDRQTRLRPYHFQFTEPSFEIDITCGLCKGKGCRMCKEGWLELGGAGMVHPNVLRAGHIDPEKFSGFAFGWGVERTYMMKAGVHIDDIRLLYGNDIRFLTQF
jgi:phenylalanyl-tRNA synthetase alpha chain